MSGQHYYMPSEWHRQSAVQLTWPHEDTDWRPYLAEITDTCVDIVRAVAMYEPVVIAARNPAEVCRLLGERLDSELASRVVVYECDNDDTWARDHAFITLLDAGSDTGKARLVDFRFNGWGGKFAASKDNRVSTTLYALGAFNGQYRDAGDFVLEGGSVESDGKGTILTTSQCLLAPHRNQPLTRHDIGRRLAAELGAGRVLWLDHGNLIGDDTDGHVDTIVRMAPGDTLVYVGCDDRSDPQYADFRALERQLRSLVTADGRPYRLLRLPMPDAIFDGDERLPATYANFLIVNGAVIVPVYGQEGKDREALDVVAEAFPGRDIVAVDSCTIIRQHGSIHCLTMQYPEGVASFGGKCMRVGQEAGNCLIK